MYLEPFGVTLQVRAVFRLCDDAFEVVTAGHTIQTLAVVFEMVAIETPLAALNDDETRWSLAVDQRDIAQIFGHKPANRMRGTEDRRVERAGHENCGLPS